MITDIPVKYDDGTGNEEDAVIDTQPKDLDFPEPVSQEGLLKDPALETRPSAGKAQAAQMIIDESEIDRVAEHIIKEQSKPQTGKFSIRNIIKENIRKPDLPEGQPIAKTAAKPEIKPTEEIPKKSDVVGNLYVSDEDWNKAVKAAYGNEPDETDEDTEKKQKKLREIILPEGLQKKAIKQYLTAVIVSIITIVMLVELREIQLTLGFLLAGVLVYNGISMTYDYDNGKIAEIAVLCATIRYNPARRNTHVVFRTNDEIPKYFDFNVPGKHYKEFIPNYPYIVYFRIEAEKQLLGYTAL